MILPCITRWFLRSNAIRCLATSAISSGSRTVSWPLENDPHEPLSAPDAVAYALEGLDQGPAQPGGDGEHLSKTAARAFIESGPLDAVLDRAGRIPTKTIERDLKAFLGEDIRRLAKARGVTVDRICRRLGADASGLGRGCTEEKCRRSEDIFRDRPDVIGVIYGFESTLGANIDIKINKLRTYESGLADLGTNIALSDGERRRE